ncbi:NAD(+) synthase [Niameybacter massiliensis]|uniref:NH(3)-dependent NAD(+) synthetase n=1 Tax=Holtiella tumoricola TaxID=3018743 RepID=A0AA42DQC0_9FIRM|nr:MULTISPECIES: NAD(+) synthase [Lachnospirales]MDA3733335.1 NAD(+) synthase [Holtiella tumoricola]
MDEKRLEHRLNWIREHVKASGCKGVVVGESGGKDSATVTALCVRALGKENVVGVTMPCNSLSTDMEHARLVADAFGIKLLEVNIASTFNTLKETIQQEQEISDLAAANIKPRIRMTTLYAVAQSLNYLVIGTDNLSEMVMGYFTKWGDGGYDFNPLGDLTMQEVLELGRELGVPEPILTKAPSAGLWEGQTDEKEMGVTYKAIEEYIKTGTTDKESLAIIERTHRNTQHKREMPYIYRGYTEE